jgi:hyperosmotically inducible periplasmic protein
MNRFTIHLRNLAASSVVGLLALISGCQQQASPDVKPQVRQLLDQAGYKDVSVSQDREKGVVTLTGSVATDNDKSQAESIARSAAAGQVIANQISVRPPGNEGVAKDVQSDLDKAIDKMVDATLVQHHLNHDISYKVKEGVVTLKGTVRSQSQRTQAEKLVAAAPDVRQVVNEIEVKGQKASSSPRSE